MKSLATLALCIFFSLILKAQITLDTTINRYLGYDFKAVQISKDETKWFFADTLNNTFSLLNMDFTPFLLNIVVPEPFAPATSYMQALYITRSLFDCDSTNIEYAYYTPKNIGKSFKVVRTDGTILFQKDSANGPYIYGNTLGGTDHVRPIINTSVGAKLFLQPYPLLLPIHVYSLCGELPVDIFDLPEVANHYMEVFPNPSKNELSFLINAPSNIGKCHLTIFDINGKEIRGVEVSPTDQFILDVTDFSSGGYYYSLNVNDQSKQSGKFIIQK